LFLDKLREGGLVVTLFMVLEHHINLYKLHKVIFIMPEKLEGQLDEFELSLGLATLAPPEIHRIISRGIMMGETPEEIDRKLDAYREMPKYSAHK